MKMKKIINSFNFCQDLTDIFTIYTKTLEEYFKDPDNVINHNVLYNYYCQLDSNIKNAIKKNGLLKDE